MSLNEALAVCRSQYERRNARSQAYLDEAAKVLPGGNTRSVLHYAPFPLLLERGEGAKVWDVDGHDYIDCVGEFSAGLYGHSNPIIAQAIRRAVDGGTTLGGQTKLEYELASILCRRFPSIELIRFCNSGTEANLLAISTALLSTGRTRIIAFRGAYHGSVLSFPDGGNPLNMPFEIQLETFNDVDRCVAAIGHIGKNLAAVIVEPMLGAAGNIPASHAFLVALRNATAAVGAVLIFDEVKTSRLGSGGLQKAHSIQPDMTTLGKFIGGGLPLGAFGGRAELMKVFDPRRPSPIRHAGTFNNNVCSLSAGVAGLAEVFTETVAAEFYDRAEALRRRLCRIAQDCEVPVTFSGLGSIFTIQFTGHPVTNPGQLPVDGKTLASLFHVWCINNGLLVASRGDFFLSLPFFDGADSLLPDLVERFCLEYGSILRRQVIAGILDA
jgi:glutamate-1-semialdehyde 2,1-aminomutase